MIFDYIYYLSNFVVFLGFVLSIRLWRQLSILPIITTGFMAITAMLWKQIPTDISDSMYDIAFILVVICIFSSKLKK